MMKWNAAYWIKFSLINLMIIASLGVLMRYKIGFDFPYLTQKNILHAHSHFAFSGWITHTVYVLMIYFITNKIGSNHHKQYKLILIANLGCSYGMLISFFFTGYSFISITLSSLTILNNCFLMYYLFKDFRKAETYYPSISWFKAAMWFGVLSSAGTFYLAYMMASRNFNEHWYLASVYFYLHFQYNGFFTFACFGLMIYKLPEFLPNYIYNKRIFVLFFSSCIFAYFLSVLWANIPGWLYAIVLLAAIIQIIAWYLFLKDIVKALRGNNNLPRFSQLLFSFVALAFTVKLILQLGSTHPQLSKLAFGFRPVVIAYLHLVLLAVISLFLLGYFYSNALIHVTKNTTKAIYLFMVGVFLNELVLAIQGIASFSNFPIRYVNEILFIISLILFCGSIMIVLSQLLYRKLS